MEELILVKVILVFLSESAHFFVFQVFNISKTK